MQAGGELSPLLISRNWESLPGVEALRVKPFYLGSVWRDWGFARAARAAWRQAGADLVQSHERIPGAMCFAPATACTRSGWTRAWKGGHGGDG